MKKYYVERVDSYKGYQYAIVLQNLGHRCAYINVINTPLQYIDYNNLDYIDVHGGLTYSSEKLCNLNDGWWIGWDYAHFNDRSDYESVLFYICENGDDFLNVRNRINIDKQFSIGGIIYTQPMVLKEVHEAIDEMIERGILNAR